MIWHYRVQTIWQSKSEAESRSLTRPFFYSSITKTVYPGTLGLNSMSVFSLQFLLTIWHFRMPLGFIFMNLYYSFSFVFNSALASCWSPTEFWYLRSSLARLPALPSQRCLYLLTLWMILDSSEIEALNFHPSEALPCRWWTSSVTSTSWDF